MADIRTVIEDLQALEDSLSAAGNRDGQTRIAQVRTVLQQKENDPVACIYTVGHIQRMLGGSSGLYQAAKPGENTDPQSEEKVEKEKERVLHSCTSFLEDQGR